MLDKKFVKTSDDKTRELLLKNGYTLFNKEGSYWVFLNDGKKINFTEVRQNVILTDYLYG